MTNSWAMYIESNDEYFVFQDVYNISDGVVTSVEMYNIFYCHFEPVKEMCSNNTILASTCQAGICSHVVTVNEFRSSKSMERNLKISVSAANSLGFGPPQSTSAIGYTTKYFRDICLCIIHFYNLQILLIDLLS